MVRAKRLLVLPLLIAAVGCVSTEDYSPPANTLEALEMVPADAQAVAFANAEGIVSTMEGFVALDESEEVQRHWNKALEEFERIGLDPREDVQTVVVYASHDRPPVAIATGSFDVDAVDAFLKESGEVVAVEADGLTAWAPATAGERPGVMGISADGRYAVAASSVAAAEAALEVEDSADLTDVAGPVMALDAWMVVKEFPEMPVEAGNEAHRALVLAVQSAAAGGTLTTETAAGTMVLYPREGIATDDLAAVVRGAIAALRLQELPKEAREQLERIEVREQNDRVLVTGTLDLAILDSINGA